MIEYGKDRQVYEKLVYLLICLNVCLLFVAKGQMCGIGIGIVAPYLFVPFLFYNKNFKRLTFADEVEGYRRKNHFAENVFAALSFVLYMAILLGIIFISESFYLENLRLCFFVVSLVYLCALFRLFICNLAGMKKNDKKQE